MEEIIERKVTTVPISEAPQSVRDWDHLKAESVRSSSPKGRSHSHRPSRSRRSSSPKEEVIKKTIIREVSPAHTSRSRRHSRSRRGSSPKEEVITKTIIREVSPAHTHRSHRHSSVHGAEIIERREIIEDDIGESNSIHAGPLALVVDRHPKSDRDIKDEIRALEAERKAIRTERLVEIRRPSRYVEEDREIIIARPAQEEVIEIRKDKKGRMSLAVPK